MTALPGYHLTPYCGAPPTPGEIFGRWNLDPVLIAVLIAAAGAYALATRDRTSLGETRRRPLVFLGWAVASLALISPLCPLSVALFSARVGQHLILTTIAAPLIGWGLPGSGRWARASQFPAAASFVAALWFWHAPGPYTATFDAGPIYWTMHVTTLGAAIWFWWALAHAPRRRLAAMVACSLAVSLGMALLGAVITFAGQPVYTPHLLTAGLWGLSPLQDQQLGGTIMWAPAGVIFVGAILLGLLAALREPVPSLMEAQA